MKEQINKGSDIRVTKRNRLTKVLLAFTFLLSLFTVQAQSLHQTAPTKFITVNGSKFSYRSFGQTKGTPLVFLQHFTGTMDNWDPILTDALAKKRPVILFDNRGVGGSEGDAPTTVKEMSEDAVAFINALGYKKVDLIGFSLGGFIAQQLVADHPHLVRKLILAGTAHHGGDIVDNTPVIENKEKRTQEEQLLYLFFDHTPTSQAAGKEFLKRINARQINRDQNTKVATILAQNEAIQAYIKEKDESYPYLKKISQPVLIVNGIRDIMVPTHNSFLMAQQIKNAKLIIYPDSGHGSLFQYSKDFAAQSNAFLDQID